MKLTLLTTTAIIALSMTSTAQATDSSWVDNLTQSVQTWFAGDEQASAEVETYLDEVTIAVPPMTGEEAAAIQPAAGDYQESLEEAIQSIPGSIQNDQSFNTEFSNDTGSIAAFEDGVSADDLANIMPAAGDAGEMMDDAISTMTKDTQNDIVETAIERIQPESLTTQVEGAAELIAAPTTETVTEMAKDAAEDKVAETVESATETIAVEAAETVADDAMTQAKDMAMDKAEEMVKEAIEPATGAMTDTAVDTMKGMLK